MRRRHRHLNPIHAGATYAWDTRFNKDSLTDGTAVGTWTDRGGSTATESVSGNRPSWEDDATNNINGVPVVKFDGSNDRLQTASTTSATALSCVAVCKRPWTTGKYAPIVASNYGATAGIAFLPTGSAFWDWQTKDFLLTANGYQSGRNPRAVGPYGSISDNTPRVFSGVLSSSVSRIWMDGAQISTRVEATASVPSVSAAVYIGGSPGTSDYGDMSFAVLSYWRNTGLSDSLRRRMEHAAAYSCKVPAS